MKTFLFLFSCSLLALSAGAQKIEPVKTTDGFGYVKVIAGTYTCDGKGRILIFEDGNGNKLPKLKIFNEDLNEEKSFQFENSDDVVSYTLTSLRDTVYTDEKQPEQEFEITYLDPSVTDINDVTIDNFKDFVKYKIYGGDEYRVPSYLTYKEIARTSTTVTFELGLDEKEAKGYFGYENNLRHYKGTFECSIVNTTSDKGAAFKGVLSIYVCKRTFTGDWKDTKEYGNSSRDFLFLRECNVVDNNKKDNGYYITQNLFNKDILYEYIMPIYELYESQVIENDRDRDGEIDERKTYYSTRTVGFKIVQDNGKVLSSVRFGDGFSLNSTYDRCVYYINFANKKYLMVNVEKKTGDERGTYSIFYSIDPSDPTSLKAVRTEKTGIKVVPAVARQSEVVNVDVSKFKNPRHVSVVSSNGQTVMTRHIADGQSHVEVQTSSLPAGLYIVRVTDGQSVSDNCKIIIR